MLRLLLILFQHPWAIAILFLDELHCSGSILSESYVLTAAHCFQDEGIHLDETKMAIVAGSSDPASPIPGRKRKFVQKRKVEYVKIHPLSEISAAKYMILLPSKSIGLSPLETQGGQFASLKQHNLEHSIPAEGILWSDLAEI